MGAVQSQWQVFRSLYHRSGITLLVAITAAISFILHMAVSMNYGYFRDELYFLAMSHNPDFGYVDVPPLVPWLTIIIRLTTGNALWAIHLISSAMCAGTILLTGRMAKLLGGNATAQGLAALGTATALVLISTGSIYAYDVFDEFWWALLATFLITLLREEKPHYWIPIGIVAGLGLLTKDTILFWGFAIVVAFVLTPQRPLLFNRWSLYGGLIALVLVSPFLLWNATHDWATLQYWGTYAHNHSSDGSFVSFLLSQILVMNPLSVPLWGAGLWYVFSQEGRKYRVFGLAYVLLLVLFALLHSKSYFLTPAYLPLYAGGSLVWVKWAKQRRWQIPTYASALAISGILLAPGVLPVLPPAVYGSYYGFLAGSSGAQQGSGTTNPLPQILADRFGWESLTAQVSQVYHALPQQEQSEACIFASNYGEAGAIYQFGPQYHLPAPVSGHNAFYIWGPRGCSGHVVISIGLAPADAQQMYASVDTVATTSCTYCVAYENDAPILVLRQPKYPINRLWASIKLFT